MKKTFFTTLIVIVFTGILNAQHPVHGYFCDNKPENLPEQRRIPHDDPLEPVLSQLELTSAQQEDMEQFDENLKKTKIRKNAEIEILEIDLHQALKNLDFQQARETVKAIALMKEELALLRIDRQEHLWNLLNKEQREKFREFKYDHEFHKMKRK
ncbi:MAG: hypothetical protein JXB60_08380 [Candidatus Cloacimonetes bacterium]|nr:hypothetical protein [Candidatus Cloacimonadota bacterium]